MAKRRGPEIQIGGGARYSSQRIAERPAAAAPLRVHFDGSPSWPAIEIVDTWNGFPIPRVTRAVRDQIASWLEKNEPDSDSAAEMRAIAARPDGSIVLRGFTFWDNRGRSAIDPAEEIAQLRRMATRPAAPASATSRAYYYLRHNDKTIGGPYLTIQKLATAARRKLGAGQEVEAKRLVAGQWADLTEGEAEAVAALL